MRESATSITFLPTGEIDSTSTSQSDLDKVNTLLQPTISPIQTIFGDNTLDVWKLFNWLFVSIYWILLADLGQIAPTTYPYSQLPQWQGYPSYATPTRYPQTNNIFYNETLFKIYRDYLSSTIVPIVQSFYGLNLSAPNSNFDMNNRIQPIPMTFIRSYSCTQTVIKQLGSLLISVLVADYALVIGAYQLAVFIGGWWEKTKSNDPKTGE